jgi:hypothetical protein
VVKVPIKGTESNQYYDKKTGAYLGAGEHEVTGITTITINATTLAAETTLNSNTVIGIDLAKTPALKNLLKIQINNNGQWSGGFTHDFLQVMNFALYGAVDRSPSGDLTLGLGFSKRF